MWMDCAKKQMSTQTEDLDLSFDNRDETKQRAETFKQN